MRTALSRTSLLEPRSLSEALRWMRDEPAVPLAGCTDVYVGFNFGTQPARRFINIWQLDQLRGISTLGRGIRIGALATWSEIASAPVVRKRLPMLCEAALQIGGVQIQNRGTIGGNIANGSPAGDSLPVLMAADAIIEVRGADHVRRLPMTSFYTGYRQTGLRPDELIVAIEVPQVDGVQWFRKVGTRAAQSISKVVMAAVRAGRPRIALGSVAPTVVRVTRTEDGLASGATLREAQDILREEIRPIDDMRSSAVYRREVAANLLARFWSDTQ
jgi:xanthine dehydrogenase small subunit